MLIIKLDIEQLTCDNDKWSGTNNLLVNELNIATSKLRDQDMPRGTDPDPDGTMLTLARNLLLDCELVARDPAPIYISGAIH